MRSGSIVAVVAAVVALLAGPPAVGSAVPAEPFFPGSSGSGSAAPNEPCRPGTPDIAPETTTFYDADRQYLGPDPLPEQPPVAPLLPGYQRFGALDADAFVAKYRTDEGWWIYPPDDGFEVLNGEPVRYEEVLSPGERLDRFGYAGGAFLAPQGDSFAERALPPQNLNTPSGTPLSNYHQYCVLESFRVDAGPIAAWFEQPGGGTQYKLESSYLPEAGQALSVTWLLDNGYLVEERPTGTDAP
ncbi:TNT domain-containing protein [Nocardia mangyaensis]|uniref:TNT domain-containing protein n=1 Tax=Nocardia mangyaensis TaxID=2213200 RepID=UPI000A029591|nr:TNT domain-containing protein [Nocardia mangyaensis]